MTATVAAPRPTRQRIRWGTIASYSLLVGASLVALFPIFWTLSTSIKTRVDSYAIPPKFVQFSPTAKNYRQLFSNTEFTKALTNTISITFTSTLLCVFVGSLAAYALARTPRFPGRRPLEASLLLARAIPGIVLMVPLYDVVTRLRLYDNRLALVVIYAAANLPFAIWLMTSFIEQIPIELEECARTDGAGRLAIVLRIVAPLSLPGLAATMIFVALLAWNEFLIPVILAGPRSKTLPVYISSFVSNRTLDWGPMAAASCLAIIPIALLTIAVQRQLVSGLTTGAVKQ